MPHSGLAWEKKKGLLISQLESSPPHQQPTWNFRAAFFLFFFLPLQLSIGGRGMCVRRRLCKSVRCGRCVFAARACVCALAFSWLRASFHFPQRKQIKIWHLSQLPLISCFSLCRETTKTAKYSTASGGWNLSTPLNISNVARVEGRRWCSSSKGVISPPINGFLNVKESEARPGESSSFNLSVLSHRLIIMWHIIITLSVNMVAEYYIIFIVS